MKSSTCVAIVTFNPSVAYVRETVRLFRSQGIDVLVVDNGSSNAAELGLALEGLSTLVRNPENEGIAAALNRSLRLAREGGYANLLTLDQDSRPEPSICHELEARLRLTPDPDRVLLVAPHYRDRKFSPRKRGVSPSLTAITSGSLVNVAAATAIGGFLDKLFIDFVDHEFCLRGLTIGYSVEFLDQELLDHQVGDISAIRIPFVKTLFTTNHSPVRRYYQYRNRLFVYRRYFRRFPRWVARSALAGMRTLALILLFERSKGAKLRMVFRGILDFFRGRYGAYK